MTFSLRYRLKWWNNILVKRTATTSVKQAALLIVSLENLPEPASQINKREESTVENREISSTEEEN